MGVITTEYLALLGATVAGTAIAIGGLKQAADESTKAVSQGVTHELRQLMRTQQRLSGDRFSVPAYSEALP